MAVPVRVRMIVPVPVPVVVGVCVTVAHLRADYAAGMAFSAAEGRQQLLDTLAEATDRLGVALEALGEAYELLDEVTADRLEEQLFRPLQLAYGRARRTHAGFAERHGLPGREFAPAPPRAPSTGVRGFVEIAADEAQAADETLGTLQDSMLPVEVGDPEVRADLADVRTRIGALPPRADAFIRTLGR